MKLTRPVQLEYSCAQKTNFHSDLYPIGNKETYRKPNAARLIRKMRGGSQAHLIETKRGTQYVVKFQNNPQHRRILINEWITTSILQHLNIPTPPINEINLSTIFLRENPKIHIQLGFKEIQPEPGEHFGSLYFKNKAIFDFLPDFLLHKIRNFQDFYGILVVDKWLGNVDSRQAIFVRRRNHYLAKMIDHGYMFGGGEWNFTDAPRHGLYFRPEIYKDVRSIDDFQPWLEKVKNFPETELLRIMRSVPAAWLQGDEDALFRLVDRLIVRRSQTERLILDLKDTLFPQWGKTIPTQ